MIAQQYIDEALRIRKQYLLNINKILEQEPVINEKKNIALKIQDDMETTVKSDLNEIRKSTEIDKKLLSLDKEIKKIQDIIKPYYDNIDKLKNDADRLYLSIKEKYLNLDEQTIKNIILSKMDE